MTVVDSKLAHASKELKTRKQRKRAIARARRIAMEGVRPYEFWCRNCEARPHEYCRTPGGRLLGGFHSTHKPRRQEAKAYTDQILQSGRDALDHLISSAEGDHPNPFSLKNLRTSLASLSTDFGPITRDYRFLIEDLYTTPTPKKWGTSSGIVLAPTPGFGLTP